MSAQKLESKIITPSSVYTGFIYHSPYRSGQYFQLIPHSPSSSVLFTGLPSIRAYPRATPLPFFQNSPGLHGSQCIQVSPAEIPAVVASFGPVPAQDFKTTLPPATALRVIYSLASFSVPACGWQNALDRVRIPCFAVQSLAFWPWTRLLSKQHQVERGGRIKWSPDKAVSPSGLSVSPCEGFNFAGLLWGLNG